MRRQPAIDVEVAAVGAAQDGVVSRAQLRALGLGDAAIDHRVRAGRLHVVHRGVYAVGHPLLGARGRWTAATLATGGVLSHRTAAAAWEMLPVGAGAIHVSVCGHGGRERRTGLVVHRTRTLGQEDIQIEAHPSRPGSPSLQAVLARYTVGSAITRSELEEMFLRLCDDHGLPRPEVNARIERMECDFVWRDARLIVEVDGFTFHRSRFAEDRERDVLFKLAGWEVLRFAYEHVSRRAAWVAAAVRRSMAG